MPKLNKAQIIILIVVVILLNIPAIEMVDGTSEVDWSYFDFLVAFIVLASLGLSVEMAIRAIKSTILRRVVIALLILLFALLWGEMAVGIFNSPIAGD